MQKDKYISYRIVGNATNLAVLSYMLVNLSRQNLETLATHHVLKEYLDLGLRYYTIWNVILQMIYNVIALVCDVATLCNMESVISDGFRKFRYTLFSGVVFPVGPTILTFWPYFLYDREIIYPRVIDTVIPLTTNLMFHGGVFLYVLWELVFLPRESIKNEGFPLKYGIGYGVAYIITLYYTKYVDKGVWCYRTMTHFEHSPVLFYSIIVVPKFVGISLYFLQFRIKDALWRWRDTGSKVE